MIIKIMMMSMSTDDVDYGFDVKMIDNDYESPWVLVMTKMI